MGTKLKLIVVTGLATGGLAAFLIPANEDPARLGGAPKPASQGQLVAGVEIPMVDSGPGNRPSQAEAAPTKPASPSEPKASTRASPANEAKNNPQRRTDEAPAAAVDNQPPAPESRSIPSDITKSAEFQKAIQQLQKRFPDRSPESLAGDAKELALRQFEAASPRPLEVGETSAMREQHFVVKVRNGRGKARAEAAVNIEMRSETGATPKDISFVLNFDPGMELLEAKAGPSLIGRKSITTTPLSGGKVYVQVTGDTSLIQDGVFLSLRFAVVSTEGNTEIYPSQLTTTDRGEAKIGGLGAIMTIEP